MNCNGWRALPGEALPPEVRIQLGAHAREAYPQECCGVLLGRRGPATAIAAALRCRNSHAEPGCHYAIAPDELAAAADVARACGHAITGFYHSHPGGPASLSREDERSAGGWHGFRPMLQAVIAVSSTGVEIAVFEADFSAPMLRWE